MSAPKLRFKEFDGDWEKTTLGEVVKFSNGKRVPLSETDRQKRQGTYRYYGASGVIDYVDDYLFDGQYILIGEDGANIITRSSTLAFVVEGQFWVNNHAHIFQSKHGDNVFLATYLESLNYERFNSGTAQPKLNLENLKKVPVANPPKPEQTKIASFLSAVDEKLSQLTQKHELLSQYKQGMMQNLFSQQIRFKADDGSEFGEWVKVRLKDILISYRLGGNYSNSEIKTSYPLIKMGNLSRGSINLDKIEYIPNDEKIDKEDLIKTNDLFFNTRNTLDLVGKVAIWKDELPQAYYNSNLMRLEFENNIFMNYLFNEQSTLEKLKSIASGTTSVAAIYTKDLLKINLEIPCLEEQTKIANFLSSIDQKIEVVAQQIEQAKQWKKGLLQQMFV